MAQSWAKAMFDHTSFDFGEVAAGTTTEHSFPVKNIYPEDVHVASIPPSCNCLKSEVAQPLLKAQEQSEIKAVLDTRNVKGHWEATITVVFDQPFPAEVQLQVCAQICSNILVEPSEARFESVEQGTSASRTLTVSCARRPDWRIDQVKPSSPYLDAIAVERGRDQAKVTYELQLQLKPNTPAGYLREQLMLVTNDPVARAREILVPVDARIVSAVQVSPSPLPLGILRPGQRVTKSLVVQGKTPFRVLKATGPDDRFAFQRLNQPKTLQLVPITFTADETEGPIRGTIHLETDLSDTPAVEVNVHGQIVPREPAAPAESRSPTGALESPPIRPL